MEDFVNDDGVDILGTRKRAKTSTRRKWSKDEEDELRKYFSIYILIKRQEEPARLGKNVLKLYQKVKGVVDLYTSVDGKL